MLIGEFHRYFPGFEHDTPVMAFTKNPFRFPVEDFSEDEEDNQEEFLEMIHDSSAKISFEDETLGKFWAKMQNAYPKITANPLKLLTAFPSTYLSKSAFSSVVALKTKARNRLLDLESDLRCAISKINPDIQSIV
uniref:SCAN domain-containing protein 3-like n=1 Tax=Styela clava TaxID=7725 RepID=UPI00193ABC52|nr:SCAN domain-containing protein 3-like [Styela clava]